MLNACQEIWFRFAIIRKIPFSVFRWISFSYFFPILYSVFVSFFFFYPNDEQNYSKEIKLLESIWGITTIILKL